MNPHTIWAMYYANLVAMRMHPGYQKTEKLHLAELALVADEMLTQTTTRFPQLKYEDDGRVKWPRVEGATKCPRG